MNEDLTKRKSKRMLNDILLDYFEFLLEKKLMVESDRQYYLEDKAGRDFLYEQILSKVYETEVFDGVTVNTLDSFYVFCRFIIGYDVATGKYVWNSFLKTYFLDVERHRYTSIMASRSTGKSFGNSLYILHKMFQNPYVDVVYVSNIPKQSKKIVGLVKRIVFNNEVLLKKRSFDEKCTEKEFGYNKGLIETSSLGTPPQGAHVNLIIMDDLLRDGNLYSNQYIEDFVYGQIRPCGREKKARQILIGTPFNSQDIFHISMMDNKDQLISDGRISTRGWYCKMYPAVKDWDNQVVTFPDRFTWEELMIEKRTMDAKGKTQRFMREYQLKCITDQSRIFPQKLLDKATNVSYIPYDIDDWDFDAEKFRAGIEGKQFVIGVDIATSGAASADNSSFVVLEVKEMEEPTIKRDDVSKYEDNAELNLNGSGNYVKIIRYVFTEKGVPIPEQVDKIEYLAKLFNNAFVLLEQNNVGIAHLQVLQQRNINVEGFVTSKPKKEAGIRFLYTELHNNKLIFPNCNSELDKVKEELMNFGIKKTRDGGEKMSAINGHDDRVMALMIANLATQVMTFENVLPVVQN
jgi:hypothetical protein